MRIGPFALYARVADLSKGHREGGLENLGGRIVFVMRNTQLARPAPGGCHDGAEAARQMFRMLPELIR